MRAPRRHMPYARNVQNTGMLPLRHSFFFFCLLLTLFAMLLILMLLRQQRRQQRRPLLMPLLDATPLKMMFIESAAPRGVRLRTKYARSSARYHGTARDDDYARAVARYAMPLIHAPYAAAHCCCYARRVDTLSALRRFTLRYYAAVDAALQRPCRMR